MKNNYIITIDLHKLYNKNDNINSTIDKFTSLVDEYYMIDNYNFAYTNNNIFKNYVIDKHDVDIVIDNLNNSKIHNILKYNSGIILFDLSMINDKFIKLKGISINFEF